MNKNILNFFFFLLLFCNESLIAGELKYKRSDWSRQWADVDGDCQDARAEILIERSLEPVVLRPKGCKVKSGKWNDYFYPEIHTDAKQVQIDHLIPLKHAHISGGAGWTKAQKKAFYHDPENLVITSNKNNQKKGAKGLSQWVPSNKEYACKYSKDFLNLKGKYHLTISKDELEAVTGCPK